MTGDFTTVPLRDDDPWTGSRLQQGRVLLDGDWNLNLDAAARELRSFAEQAIGPAGVPASGTGFEIGFAADGTLQIGAGEMWVGGLRVVNATALAYAAQEAVAALPQTGNALLYLDAFVQEVQAAEDPTDLLDPALDGVDTTTRTRVGWRVHAVAVDATSCAGAAGALPAEPISTGRLDVVRTSPAVPADPCAPPDDPRGKLPDGLLRVEVLDSGTEGTARFAWSYENGSAAVAATVAGTTVTLAPSPSTSFFPGDLVEVSTLVRRADRLDCGALFTVDDVAPGAAGSVITLAGPPSVTGTPAGLCLRRWDGQVVGAAAPTAATLGGTDVGVAFTAGPGSYLAGDWWAARVRGSSADAVETRSAAAPDGNRHYAASLAVVDLTAHTVLTDCRPAFPPLTSIRGGTCTVTAFPGDDLQTAADQLPASGGELCLAAGTYRLDAPVTFTGKSRVVVTGIGPASVLAAAGECALEFVSCSDVTVRDLRAESGTSGQRHLLGAVSFLGCADVTVRDCELSCPDNTGRDQSAIYVSSGPNQDSSHVRVLDNKIEVGDQQSGVLITSVDESLVAGNEIRLRAPSSATTKPLTHVVGELARFIGSHVDLLSPALPAAPREQPAAKTAAKKATPAKKAAATKTATEQSAPTEAAATGHPVTLPGETTIVVHGASQIQRLADQFGRAVNAKTLAHSTPRKLFERYVRRAVLAPNSLDLSGSNARFLAAAATSSRAMAQGIVIGGGHADLVRVRGNLVSGAIQGIHVGLSGRGGVKNEASQVIISENIVQCTVPFFWARSRHAFYVGSFDRLTMTDNAASLTRIGGTSANLASVQASTMEAVRVHGRLGQWLTIRVLELAGPFTSGVVITATQPYQGWIASQRYVSDVLNGGQTGPALTPSDIPHDRCSP